MRLLPANIHYYGIDIAIHDPAPNLMEADLVESEIAFGGKRFDLVSALGVFEYVGQAQSRKFSEIAKILNADGKFIVTYTNFGHRKPRIYEPFSNVQPLDSFRQDLRRYFTYRPVLPGLTQLEAQPAQPRADQGGQHAGELQYPLYQPGAGGGLLLCLLAALTEKLPQKVFQPTHTPAFFAAAMSAAIDPWW